MMDATHTPLHSLAQQAQGPQGTIQLMARKGPAFQKDIPAASEFYAFLLSALNKTAVQQTSLDEDAARVSIAAPAVHHDEDTRRVLVLANIAAGMLPYEAHWITQGLFSASLKEQAGVLALPFMIQPESEATSAHCHLMPDWFAAFYVDGNPAHCIPILALKSMQESQLSGFDWVELALLRMAHYGLPQQDALNAVEAFNASARTVKR